MCGICGFWGGASEPGDARRTVLGMAQSIGSRGPDSAGALVTDCDGPVFGHRRLAIIDVSEAGAQPMVSQSRRFSIVYNGEIYNHLDLRAALEAEGRAPDWRGHSDTETILACFDAWGVDETLARLDGMFAFALWDAIERTLYLARDRLGEKPLYYGWMSGIFLFGSEIKALRRHASFRGSVDRGSLTAMVGRGYVPSPRSIYAEIAKLLPGHLLKLARDAEGNVVVCEPSQPYWSLNRVVEIGLAAPYAGGREDGVTQLRRLLVEVVQSQMISDVPIGAFLSGGIDSSLITAIMQESGASPVRTFSIGFEDAEFDESASARAVADRIGTDHVDLIVTPQHLIDVLPQLPEIYCEPFADSSQLPTFFVSQLARQHVAVALTGDGADELFGGYNRYIAAAQIWRPASKLPRFVRSALGSALMSMPKPAWNHFFTVLSPLIPVHARVRVPGEKIYKMAEVLKQASFTDYFRTLVAQHNEPESLVIGARMPMTLLDTPELWPRTDSFEHCMMALDGQTYLPDDICVKVDRAAMANSLETRAPFLDRRVVEFAWSLPLSLKIRDRRSKWILREILASYIPRELFERPKMGFGVPFGKWLRGPLRAWADGLLAEERLCEEGFFQPQQVRTMWHRHLSGKGNHEYTLWNILMFQSWLDRWEMTLPPTSIQL